MLCCKVLAIFALKPSKLERHLITHHPDFQNKDADFFKHRADNLVRSRFDSTGDQWKENTVGLKASYKVARKITIAKKPHHHWRTTDLALLPRYCIKSFWRI